MAQAGKITRGWIGVNLTEKEAEALVSCWDRYLAADFTELSSKEREQHRAAVSAINQIRKAL